MTRRSITNERYTTDDAKKGVTRKSASKAKPAKEAAGTVYVKEQKKTKKELQQEEAEKEAKRRKRNESKPGAVEGENSLNPDSKVEQEIKAWRKRWWVCVILGIILVVLAWISQDVSGILFFVDIIGAYVMVGVAIYIEFAKIGKLRKQEDMVSTEKITNKQIKHQAEAKKQEESRKAVKKSKSKRRKKKDSVVENYPMDED